MGFAKSFYFDEQPWQLSNQCLRCGGGASDVDGGVDACRERPAWSTHTPHGPRPPRGACGVPVCSAAVSPAAKGGASASHRCPARRDGPLRAVLVHSRTHRQPSVFGYNGRRCVLHPALKGGGCAGAALSARTQIFFVNDSPQGPPTANRHQPPTAAHGQPLPTPAKRCQLPPTPTSNRQLLK